MNAVLVSKENNVAKFTMAFTAEEFDAALDKAYKAQRGKIEVPGFRKGKAPRSVIEKRYGEGIFFEDAIDNCLADGYPAALDQLALEPVDRPDLSFGEEKLEKGKGFEVTVTVTVAPEVVVKDYKGVKVEVTKKELNEEDVEGELKAMQQRNARLVVVDRPAEDGDTVVLDYEGWCEEKQFEGGTAENQTLILGSGQFIPGFEEQLVGCKAGDAKDVEVTFPEEYHAEELAGKPAVFKCRIHEVKTQELPELDDEFAKDVSEFDTLEEVKKDIREKLEKTLQDAKEYEGKDKVLQQVYEANPLELPQAMIDSEAANMLNEFGYQLQSQGLNLDQYCKYLNKTQQQMVDEFKPDAEKRVKSQEQTHRRSRRQAGRRRSHPGGYRQGTGRDGRAVRHGAVPDQVHLRRREHGLSEEGYHEPQGHRSDVRGSGDHRGRRKEGRRKEAGQEGGEKEDFQEDRRSSC